MTRKRKFLRHHLPFLTMSAFTVSHNAAVDDVCLHHCSSKSRCFVSDRPLILCLKQLFCCKCIAVCNVCVRSSVDFMPEAAVLLQICCCLQCLCS